MHLPLGGLQHRAEVAQVGPGCDDGVLEEHDAKVGGAVRKGVVGEVEMLCRHGAACDGEATLLVEAIVGLKSG